MVLLRRAHRRTSGASITALLFSPPPHLAGRRGLRNSEHLRNLPTDGRRCTHGSARWFDTNPAAITCGIVQRRGWGVGHKAAARKMLLTPIDSVAVDVGSMELRIRVAQKPGNSAPAAAPEVEHTMRRRDLDPHILDALTDQARAASRVARGFLSAYQNDRRTRIVGAGASEILCDKPSWRWAATQAESYAA